MSDIDPREAPAPALISLNPQQGMVGSNDITITISGSGFAEGIVLVWNGADDTCEFVDDTTLTTVVKLSQSSQPAQCTVAVRNTDGLVSNELIFYITEDVPSPPEPKPEESESPNTNAVPAEYMAPDPPDVYRQVKEE